MADYYFDGANFEEACRNLEESALLIDEVVTKVTLEIGEEFKETARQIAGQYSSKIPPTIRAVPVPHGVAVRAGSADVPLAALYDLGNKGKGNRRSPTFRHKVFGHDVWVEQDRHPIFAPTRKLMRKHINERMTASWEEALRPFERGGGDG